jgi:hypothetical protein
MSTNGNFTLFSIHNKVANIVKLDIRMVPYLIANMERRILKTIYAY